MKKIKTSQKGRKCKHAGCKHVLSIYNHQEYCHVHLGLFDPKEETKQLHYFEAQAK